MPDFPEGCRLRTIAEALLRQSIPRNSSCPGLSRPSTPLKQRGAKDVDGRDEPGHDGEREARGGHQ
jgi:hypothetical protein